MRGQLVDDNHEGCCTLVDCLAPELCGLHPDSGARGTMQTLRMWRPICTWLVTTAKWVGMMEWVLQTYLPPCELSYLLETATYLMRSGGYHLVFLCLTCALRTRIANVLWSNLGSQHHQQLEHQRNRLSGRPKKNGSLKLFEFVTLNL